jgi:hypothetical protein
LLDGILITLPFNPFNLEEGKWHHVIRIQDRTGRGGLTFVTINSIQLYQPRCQTPAAMNSSTKSWGC